MKKIAAVLLIMVLTLCGCSTSNDNSSQSESSKFIASTSLPAKDSSINNELESNTEAIIRTQIDSADKICRIFTDYSALETYEQVEIEGKAYARADNLPWDSLTQLKEEIINTFDSQVQNNRFSLLDEFIEYEGKLYTTLRVTFTFNPKQWDFSSINIIEQTDEKIIFELEYTFIDQKKIANMELVKQNNNWVLTESYFDV